MTAVAPLAPTSHEACMLGSVWSLPAAACPERDAAASALSFAAEAEDTTIRRAWAARSRFMAPSSLAARAPPASSVSTPHVDDLCSILLNSRKIKKKNDLLSISTKAFKGLKKNVSVL
jgi:hypothetical protein